MTARSWTEINANYRLHTDAIAATNSEEEEALRFVLVFLDIGDGDVLSDGEQIINLNDYAAPAYAVLSQFDAIGEGVSQTEQFNELFYVDAIGSSELGEAGLLNLNSVQRTLEPDDTDGSSVTECDVYCHRPVDDIAEGRAIPSVQPDW